MFFLLAVEVAVAEALDTPDTFPSDTTAAGRVGSTWAPSILCNIRVILNPFATSSSNLSVHIVLRLKS